MSMNERHAVKISKFLSLMLRHQPEKFGLKMEQDGWVNITDLLAACARNDNALTREELETIVAENDKKRFALDETRTKIRASQGHSVAVEIEFEEKTPPAILYHGTAERNVPEILKYGLKKMRRHYVHLSADAETARKVGMRYGNPVIFKIDTIGLLTQNFKFYIAANGVWLADRVPPEFLKTENE